MNSIGRLADKAARGVAPLLTSYVPFFYKRYRQLLHTTMAWLPTLPGLEPISLEEAYSPPLLLRFPDDGSSPQSVERVLSYQPRVFLYGGAGAGKTALLRWLAWRFSGGMDVQAVRNLTFKLFGRSVNDLMPIYFSLDVLSEGLTLFDALLKAVGEYGLPGAARFLRRRLETGSCVLLFDNWECLDSVARAQVADFVDAFPENIYFVASRRGVAASELKKFSMWQLEGLSSEGISRFLSWRLGEHSSPMQAILSAAERSEGFQRALSLPLVLTSACRVVRREEEAPSLVAFYADWLHALGEVKDWEAHARQPSLDWQDLASYLAYEMLVKGEEGLPEKAILPSVQNQFLEVDVTELEYLLRALWGPLGVFELCDGFVRCSSPSLQGYLAARWLAKGGQLFRFLDRVGEPGWEDALVLAVALSSEAEESLQRIAAWAKTPAQRLFFARCLAEVEKGLYPQDEIEEQLVSLLEDEAAEGFWIPAALALAGLHRVPAKEYFDVLLRQGDLPEERRRAALALGRLRPSWAVPLLGAAVSDRAPEVRRQAAWALGYIPSAQAVRVLARVLHSPFPEVRQAAARSLALQGQVPKLRAAVVRELLHALGREAEGNKAVASEVEKALLQIGKAAGPQLVAALADERLSKEQRRWLARVLGRLGDERALPFLVEALVEEPFPMLEGYIEAIAQIGEPAIPVLLQALHEHDLASSSGLIEALSRLGERAVPSLVEAIAERTPQVRRAALRALKRIGEPAMTALVHALLHDTRYDVRRQALEVLGTIGEEQAMTALLQALQDKDRGVRTNAVRYLGDLAAPEALEPLIELLEREEYPSLRREAIFSLGKIGDERAIPPLLNMLAEPLLREAAVGALVSFGERAVEPLIRALHSAEIAGEIKESIWGILKAIGARALPNQRTLAGVASAYAQLASANEREILALVQGLEWWKYGWELLRSLEILPSLAQAQDLSEISAMGEQLAWLGQVEEWLRPYMRTILWGLQDIVESINLFHKHTQRQSQRDALLSAIDRLEEIQQLALQQALPFELLLLKPVLSRWHDLLVEAIKGLRGRAMLLIKLLTPQLPFYGSQPTVVAVFSLFNEGDSAARNLSAQLRSLDIHGQGVQILRKGRINLDPLGIGEERLIEIPIAPNGCTQCECILEVRYDDDERQGVTERYTCQIKFVAAPATYIPIERSPYIVGMPVKVPQMFYGRQADIQWIYENLDRQYQLQTLLLYGERRIGKTSLLYQLEHNPPDDRYIFVLFDLQLRDYMETVAEILYDLAQTIVLRLQREGMDVEPPEWEEYQVRPEATFLSFCERLDALLKERPLVIMMDEFGVLISKVQRGRIEGSLFQVLRGIAQHFDHFTFLYSGAHEVRRMQQDFNSILFNMPKARRLTYLSEGEATALIEEPVKDFLTYHPLVVQKIRTVTACHPYFIQYICDELVHRARAQRRNYVDLTDFEYVLNGVVDDATGNIENSVFRSLSRPEKLVLAALAHVTDDVRVFVSVGDVAAMLERRHVAMSRESIMEALRDLCERELVTEMRIGQQLRYSFRMGLMRMWLVQNEILLRLVQEQEP
ncbi:MAG: HEAT repeat domain-containing protein [Anaerolineae bacterium]|nr:HEAT repeat domain-containing protein [Anaerolineae bacterium]